MSSEKLMWAITSEPFVDLTLQAYKARRNLILCCLIAWGRVKGITIEGTITVFDAKLTGLTQSLIDWLLFGGLTYFALMLIIHGFESLQKWKLRLTGMTHHEFIASIGYLNVTQVDPDQGVAYKVFRSLANRVEKELSAYEQQKELRDSIQRLTGHLESFKREMDERGEKLNLLEKKFWRHQLTLVLRFAVLDYFGPLLFASATAGYFLNHIMG